MNRGVVSQHDQLHPLQTHDPEGFRPAPVVADTHAHPSAKGLEGRKSQIAGFEIAFFEMLKRSPRFVLSVAGKVDLAVFADDIAALVDQNGGVEMMGAPALAHHFRVAQIKANTEFHRSFEQRLGIGAGHLALEKGVDVGLIIKEPTGEKSRQRQFGENHKFGAALLGLAHHGDHPGDGAGSRLAAGNGAHLGRCDNQVSCHGPLPLSVFKHAGTLNGFSAHCVGIAPDNGVVGLRVGVRLRADDNDLAVVV